MTPGEQTSATPAAPDAPPAPSIAPRRDDLLHLSPEALSHAANAGIVKRALREMAAGSRPRLEVDAAGTLDATFDDGIHCRWPIGITIQNAPCSCGASVVCRHRVIAALAYREAWQASAADASTSAPSGSPSTPTDGIAASPAAATVPIPDPVAHASDESLARVVPEVLRKAAESMRDAGMTIELRRRASGEPCETARLPAATVRYWGGAALEAARCDCLRAAACEHVALGLWAFRVGDAQDAAAPQVTVRLGAEGSRHVIDRTPFEQLAQAIVRHGVAQGPHTLTQQLTSARVATQEAAWLALVVDDLERWSAAYAQRSALYDAAEGVDLLAEAALRLTAGALPGRAAAVLGIGQAGETALDRLRLMCLGARTRRDGEARRTQLVMVDIDTGTRLVLTHAWQVPQARAADEAALRGAQRLAPGVGLEALATGQLLAQQAARRPDGSVRLARARRSQNSVLPQSGDWAQLGSPVRFDSVQALRAQHQAHPNAVLQPRHAARRFVIFSPAKIDEPAYDPHAQCVVAVMRDAQDEPVLLQRAHERHVTHALDGMAAALTGAHGVVRHVAGLLDWSQGLPVIEPWAFACEGTVVVPDFVAAPSAALPALPLGRAHDDHDGPGARELEALRQLLASLLHHGVTALPTTWAADAASVGRRLHAAGFVALASHLAPLVSRVMDLPTHATANVAARLLPLAALLRLHLDAATMETTPPAG